MESSLDVLVARFPDLQPIVPDIERVFEILRQIFRGSGKVLICGSGGSAADSEHLVAELMKGYVSPRPIPAATRKKIVETFPQNGDYLADHLQGALPAISLASNAVFLTAFANDVAPDMIFAQQVYGYGVRGDAVIAISTSGRSKNVVHALQVARALGLATIGITGKSGGDLKEICDVTICAPRELTAEIQEYQLAIYHTLCAMLEAEFFPT